MKERIIQVLTFNYLLKTYKEVNTLKSFNLELFNELKNAQIVLPSELFEDILTENSTLIKRESEVAVSEISSEEIVNQAKQNVKALNNLKEEVVILEKSYQKSYKRNYDSALNEYNQRFEPQLREYQAEIDAEKQRICKETNGEANFENYCTSPNVKYPEIPAFTFEFPAPVDEKTLTSKLSKESFATLKNINATTDNETFEDIFDKIENAFKKENETIIENTTFSNQAIMMGGVLLSENTLKRGNLPSADVRPAFVPNRFGIRNIGIADYKKVVSHVCCYDAGEVSHIENIMAKEIKEKESERIRKSEVSTTTEQTNESERFTDVSTTERFEMQTEVAKILQENESFATNASVGYSGFGFSANIGANYATSTSKEESNIQAVNYAKDITQKATEKIVSRLRTEKTVKITDEFKERYKHGYDNTQGDKHVSGVFRFVNAIYKNQIYNYGKRLMYEFMIPQPSKLHRLGMEQNRSNPNAVFLSKPIDPRIDFPNANSINEYNYKTLASKYGAEVVTFPENYIFVNKTFSGAKVGDNEIFDTTVDVPIPSNYVTTQAKLKFYSKYDNDNRQLHAVGVSFGNINLYADEKRFSLREWDLIGNQSIYYLDKYKDKISVSYFIENYHSFNISLSIQCVLSNEFIEKWKEETYQAIIKGYEDQLAKFNSQISDMQSLESNSGFYRIIENTALRKNCISYLIEETQIGRGFYTGNLLKTFALVQNQQLDNYANLVKFMEQAFEWQLMSYNFYPFYWAERNDWTELYQYECNDPLFRSFMQSGMARVVVTVRPGFEKAVLHFMATGQIWNGGEVPVLGNPLFMSIVEELKEQEYIVEESWETVVPTNLIALQNSGVAVDASGLPCGSDCNDFVNPLKPNDNTLSIKP